MTVPSFVTRAPSRAPHRTPSLNGAFVAAYFAFSTSDVTMAQTRRERAGKTVKRHPLVTPHEGASFAHLDRIRNRQHSRAVVGCVAKGRPRDGIARSEWHGYGDVKVMDVAK
jgi:hypothetical protein